MDLMSWFTALFISFLILVVFWALGKSSEYTLNNWVSILVKKTPTELDDKIVERIKKPLHYLILFTGVYIAFGRLPLGGMLDRIIDGTIYILGAAAAVYLVYSVADEVLKWYSRKVSRETESGLDKEFLPLVEKVLAIFIFMGGLVTVLKHFNQDIYTLITALGVGSLAIGLAAKDTLANMISGFTIMVDRPFRPGDRVELVSGEIGDVMEIGMRSTKIKTFFDTILVVPNSDLVNSRLINHSYPDARVNGRVEIGVAYGTDLEKAKKVLIKAALSIDEVLKDPEPKVFFTSFGDFSLNLLLIFWVESYAIRFATQDKVNMAINQWFREAGIEIPFPVRTIISAKPPAEEPGTAEENPAARKTVKKTGSRAKK